MKINFTKKEYRLLLDVVYLGQWMMNAYKYDGPDKDDEYEMLVQKIYSFANKMGCGELVMGDNKSEAYYPTRKYEDESCVQEIIDQYNDDNFWEELINRLGERDAYKKAEAAGKKLESIEEFWQCVTSYESRYAEEFESNGLKRLKLSKI